MKSKPRREALIGPERKKRTPSRRVLIVLASVGAVLGLGVAALYFIAQGALGSRPRDMLRGALDGVSQTIVDAAIPQPTAQPFRPRPGVPAGRVRSDAMTQQVVDSIENSRLPLRERYGVDQPIPPEWLKPEYLLSPSRFTTIPEQFRGRLEYATEVERRMPKRPDIEAALQRIFEREGTTSQGLLVQTIETYVIWSVGDVTSRANMAAEARDALELHQMLSRYEGSIGWDSASGDLLHPNAAVASALNAQLERLWPERPDRRRSVPWR